MDRAEFYPKNTTYLFSFDVDLSGHAQEEASDPGPKVVAGHTHEFGEEQAPVYNALGDSRELGERSIAGRVRLLQERVGYPPGHEFGELRGRLVIQTDDEESLEGTYAGVFRAGPEWHWLNAATTVRASDTARARAEGLRAKAFISMQFDVGSTKYAWLARYQCIGYGRVSLNAGCPSSATFDVYALGPGGVVPPAVQS